MKKGFITEGSLNNTFERVSKELKDSKDPVDFYRQWMLSIESSSKKGFGVYEEEISNQELKSIYSEIAQIIIDKSKVYLQKESPEIWKKIKNVDTIQTSLLEKIFKGFKNEDIQAFRRIVVNALKSNERLQKNFDQHLEEIKRLTAKGEDARIPTKKAFANLVGQMKGFNDSYFQMKKNILKKLSPEDRRLFNEKSDEFLKNLETIPDNVKLEGWDAAGENIRRWARLFPFGKHWKESLRRWGNLILRGSPSLFSETRATLVQKGFVPTVASYLAGVAIWNYVTLPLILSTFKNLYVRFWKEPLEGWNDPEYVSKYQNEGFWTTVWEEAMSLSFGDVKTEQIGWGIPITHVDEVIKRLVIKPTQSKSMFLPNELSHWDGQIFSHLPETENIDNVQQIQIRKNLREGLNGYYLYFGTDHNAKVQKKDGVWKVYYTPYNMWVPLDNYCLHEDFKDIECPCKKNNTCK
jgi:DNA-binding MarR family transcriptional regulator